MDIIVILLILIAFVLGVILGLIFRGNRTISGKHRQPLYPHGSGDYTTLGPECITDAKQEIICYKGVNYYRACDFLVKIDEDGLQSHCVLPINHHQMHEDYYGNFAPKEN